MNNLFYGAAADGDFNRIPLAQNRSNLPQKTASLIVATVLLFTGTTTLSAETRAECNVKVSANSALLDTSDVKSCSEGGGIAAALRSIVGAPAPTPTDPADPPAPAGPAAPTPGSHVAVSGTVAIDGTVSVPGGPSLNAGAKVSANDTVNSPFSTAPTMSSGTGAGGGVAGAGSVGNGGGLGAGSGTGDSFVESALSDADASSHASGLGGGIGVGAGTGFSGSVD